MKHVLLMFTDQQRYDTIAAHGNPAIQTPNLDALARDSVVFNHCITPSPVCIPARLSLFTGQFCARTGCNTNQTSYAKEDFRYKGEGFYDCVTKSGYQSCVIGKVHHVLDPYGLMGFEKRISQEEVPHPADDYTHFIEEKYPYLYDYHGMRSEMYYVPQISPLPAEDHPTQWIGDKSVEYIENCDPEKPMFLMSSFIHPHPPFCPPAPWNKLYREDPPAPYAPKPEDLADYYDDVLGDRCSCRRLMISEQDMLRQKNYYYACVSFVDYQVGRIIKALKDKGMYEDTLIIYTSDHGDMMGDYSCTGKRTMVDSACHVPFIMHYPGEQPQVREDVCSLVDVAPTVLSYAGIDYDPAEYDGVNLFGGEKHTEVYSQYGCGDNGVYMVTDGKDKLVLTKSSGRYFHFETPADNNDIYRHFDLTNPKVQELKAKLDAHVASDVNTYETSEAGEVYTKKHPHYPGRGDHKHFHEKELSRIPEGYTIDL
ncbi:MAG: sulfatase-like hydrolase/transferase [Lachnospiraceae bacterium]|nr:sulfatase-like hydrolase/transferase [Lachnospiraceae bacterium]